MKKVLSKLVISALFAGVGVAAHAEILVILPETGPLATATASLKRGFMTAYEANSPQREKLRFVDENKYASMSDAFSKEVKADTSFVIGPLARADVAQVVQLKPAVKVLALNAVAETAPNVWQFALSPEQDAIALTKQMKEDGVKELIVVRDPSFLNETKPIFEAIQHLWKKIRVVDEPPQSLAQTREGLLLLGSSQWLSRVQGVKGKRVYTHSTAIEQNVPIPEGITFCDAPGLYSTRWPELVEAYQKKPVSIPYQRLMAFGADAWQLADAFTQPNVTVSKIKFQGRTGHLKLDGQNIVRKPQCFIATSQGIRYR